MYWNKSFLKTEYLVNRKSAFEIASKFNCTENTIFYFLKKFKIKTRNITEVRKIKKWGLSGKDNPMFGKFGKQNPNWNGGHSGDRQCAYTRFFWKEIKKLVLKRDNYKCVVCNNGKSLVVHHILHWAKYPEFRFTDDNLQTLCIACHKKKHARRG